MQKFDHNIGFLRKTPFFRQKLAKIAENCDHNIDPRTTRALRTDVEVKNGEREKVEKLVLNLYILLTLS
jgi:hypothetical protein